VKEKAPTLAGDSLAAERRRMPWLAIEDLYGPAAGTHGQRRHFVRRRGKWREIPAAI
jgi:predicted dithiol-disulfide oxidoreductase (DUF899 family)